MESENTLALHDVSDDELLRRLRELVSQSRRVEADLVAHIGEVDERKLFASQAFPSMFAYCTQALHLSEAEAYRRITVARAARKHPELLERLRGGELHLSGIAMVAPFLTADNCEGILRRARHLSKRQLEELVAELSPRPDVPSMIRALPRKPAAPAAQIEGDTSATTLAVDPFQARRADLGSAAELVPGRVDAVIAPLSPRRCRVQFTADADLRDKIERLTALMRSEVPNGDLAALIDIAISEKLERLEAKRFGRTAMPRKTLAETETSPVSRHVPAAVRRAVRRRDGDRCHFVDEQGQRCSERHRLEFHHRYPFGMGGDHSPANITLLCRAHNRYLAEIDFGHSATRHRAGPTGPQMKTTDA